MASRKHRDLTNRLDGLLGSVRPTVLPDGQGRTRILFRSQTGPSLDLALVLTATGMDVIQNPDGTPTTLGTIPGAGGGGGGPTAAGFVANFPSLNVGASIKSLFPYACTITGWKAWADAGSGNVEFDIRKTSFAGLPPDSGDSIVASAPPIVNNAISASGSPTGWTTSMSRGDALEVVVVSLTGVTEAFLLIEVTKV